MKKILVCGGILLIIFAFSLAIINYLVIYPNKDKITNVSSLEGKYDAILVLGAGIRGNKPSPMLEDRLKTAYELYQKGYSDKIIVSGDHTKDDYDEVNVMKTYLINEFDIPSQDVYMDHAGISTYDSMFRLKSVFEAKKVIVVTQKYHLYRALYLGDKLDLDVVGVSADLRTYRGQAKREVREFLARIKDYFKGLILPDARYESKAIPISTNDGDVTNDKK